MSASFRARSSRAPNAARHLAAAYLAAPGCTLSKLTLRNADVDDAECARFVSAITSNVDTQLVYLDLQRNLIGRSEQLNVVQPDFVTGGEAIGKWLRNPNCRLKMLDVSWNSIHSDSAIELGCVELSASARSQT